MTLIKILLVLITVALITTVFLGVIRIIQDRKLDRLIKERLNLLDTRIQAHKHAVGKALDEMNRKIGAQRDREAPDDLSSKTEKEE